MTSSSAPAGVVLRRAAPADLDFVLALERHPENAPFIGQWPRERHLAELARADREYWIVERPGAPAPLGFAIVYDLRAQGYGVYVKRIALAEKSSGAGRAAIARLCERAARELGAERLWLSVFADNARAIRAYRAAGLEVAAQDEAARAAHDAAVGGISPQSLVMVRWLAR